MILPGLLGVASLLFALRVLAARRRRRMEASLFAGLLEEFAALEVEPASQSVVR